MLLPFPTANQAFVGQRLAQCESYLLQDCLTRSGHRAMARLLCACFGASQSDEGHPLPRTVQELIHQFPDKTISQISQFLDLTDVLSLVHTCSYLYSSVTQDDLLWKRHCRQHFMVEELSTEGNMTWYKQWLYLCREFGRYRLCYAKVKSAWSQIESFLQQQCPKAFSDLMASGGVSETELDKLEERLQVWLPNDYRCSLRLHGKLSVSLGSISYLASHNYSEEAEVKKQTFNLKAVSDIKIVHTAVYPLLTKLILNFVGIAENTYSLPIHSTHSYGIPTVEATRTFLLMVCNGEGVMRTGCALGHVFAAFSDPKEYTAREMLDEQDIGGCLSIRLHEWFRMPESCTFADWLSTEAHRMRHYYIDQQGQLTHFILKPWSEYITGFFTVRVATAVLNETPYYDTIYRSGEQTIAMCIVVEMSANAPAEDSCHLLDNKCLQLSGAQGTPCSYSIVHNPPLPAILYPGGAVEYLSKPLTITETYITFRRRLYCDADSPGQTADTGQST